MKKQNIFGLFAATLTFGFVACNNDADTTATTDSTSTMTTTETGAAGTEATTTTSSTTNYTAMADSFRMNSEAGNYLNARTGKPVKLRYDTERHYAVDETTGEPVWRYVDKRNYTVYGTMEDDTMGMYNSMGTARMQNNRLEYQGEGDTWVDYDKRYKEEDTRRMKSWKTKDGNTKIKVSKDGDIKVKDENGKVKYDADDNKIKVDSSR